MNDKPAAPGSTVSGGFLSQSHVPRWQLFQGNTVTPNQTPVQPLGKNQIKRFNPEAARSFVTKLLLFAHYGFALYSTTRGIQLSFHVSANPFDAVGMIAGILMADMVLVASMEGIRHGVFIGIQKYIGRLAYFCAVIGVGLATFAHGAEESFQLWYTHNLLPAEAIGMSFFAFILLATWFDVRIDNRRRAAQQKVRWQEDNAEVLTEELKIERFQIDLNEGKKRNKAYKGHLRASGVGDRVNKDLERAAELAGPRIMGLLGLGQVETSGDSGSSVPEAVVTEVKPVKKGRRSR